MLMSLSNKIRRRVNSKFADWFHAFAQGSKLHYLSEQVRELQKMNDYLMSLWLQGKPPSPNPLNSFGRKYFSQSDEDGILLEILRRIGKDHGVCLEIGAGDGTENNTLILASRGWKTIWIDAQPLAFDSDCNPRLLAHRRVFVNSENLCGVIDDCLKALEADVIDVISIDVDGNDGYLAGALLDGGIRPEVFIVEINELIPPPINYQQAYRPNHVWDKSRNVGISLQSLADLLSPHGYLCVGCNGQTGVNAFFVSETFAERFLDIPRPLGELFVGRSIHPYKYRDHRTQIDSRLIENILRSARVGGEISPKN